MKIFFIILYVFIIYIGHYLREIMYTNINIELLPNPKYIDEVIHYNIGLHRFDRRHACIAWALPLRQPDDTQVTGVTCLYM